MKALAVLVLFLPILFLFQNCGSPESIKQTDAQSEFLASEASTFVQKSPMPDKRFKVLWLEPMNISNSVLPRQAGRGPTKNEVRTFVRNYHSMGFEKIVIAYAKLGTSYFYEPNAMLKDQFPANHAHFQLNDGGSVIDVILDEADKLGLKVIVGLSSFENKQVIHNLTADFVEAIKPNFDSSGRVYGIFKQEHVIELNRHVNLNKMMANDLYFKYGHRDSFDGFYLTQEPHCLDVAMNLFGAVAKFIKKDLNPNLKVMISPNADAQECFGQKSSLQAQFVENHRTFLKKMKSEGIDIVAYQDSVGAGHQSSSLLLYGADGAWRDLLASYLLSGSSLNFFTEFARELRISYLKNILVPTLTLAHQNSGVEFWMNTEYWRMNGNCPNGYKGPYGYYGCNYGSAGLGTQLNDWYPYTNQIMLNEGFRQFEFQNAPLPISNTGDLANTPAAENAAAFTAEYLRYLGLEY